MLAEAAAAEAGEVDDKAKAKKKGAKDEEPAKSSTQIELERIDAIIDSSAAPQVTPELLTQIIRWGTAAVNSDHHGHLMWNFCIVGGG